jgi:hypothetical protein
MSAMRPLWLDYQRPLPGQHVPGLVLLGTSLLLCAVLLAQSMSTTDVLADTEQQLIKLRRDAERRRLFASPERAAAEAVRAEARLPAPPAGRWDALLGALENASSETVTLLSLEPSRRDITISGEARDLGATLDYVKRLHAASVFVDAYLIKHELVRENPYRPVRFTLLAQWREET